MKKTFIAALSILMAVAAAARTEVFPSATTTRASSPPSALDAAELKQQLRKLTVVGRALYVAAHPDDENTAMLSYLAGEKMVRTAYLALTRGDGGQNLIGDEKGELLGVIRTQELLAARRIDGAEQFFTRAVDFGYSKSPEETLAIWGREPVLADVVWVIRLFRPDVIITRFPTTGEGGHGHHTASAILAVEAFEAAGNPARFPEQLKYVSTWKPKRILWNLFRFAGAPPAQAPEGKAVFSADIGSYNALLGKSYTEIAGDSRSMHKSQGFGAPERRGSFTNEFVVLAGDPPKGNDLFEGIDLTWGRIPHGAAVGALLDEAARKFDPDHREEVIPILLRALAALDQVRSEDPATSDFLAIKRGDIQEAIRGVAGLWLEAIASDPSTTSDGEVKVRTTAVNRSSFPFRLERVAAGTVNAVSGKELSDNQPVSQDLTVELERAAPTQPYWLRKPPSKGLFTVEEQTLIGQPQNPPAATVRFDILAGNQLLAFDEPVLYRWTDPVAGEQYRPLEVVPAATVNLDQKVYLFPGPEPKKVRMVVRSGKQGVSGTLRLVMPAGWKSDPASVPFSLAGKNDEKAVEITVTPPPSSSSGELRAEIETTEGTTSQSLVSIDYPHIPEQTLFPPASAKLVRADVRKLGSRIGYVAGAGDEVPEGLRQIGYEVSLLSDADLEKGDLSGWDAIVTGVRAFNTRETLQQQFPRLMDYVNAGGTMVVQYNTLDRTLAERLGPFPFKLSRDRVTVEEAAVSVLAPDSPILSSPNRITQADFEGWVQERGLYFPGEWDPAYQTVISSHDPGEKDLPGGILVARHGKGKYVYTGYSFFRQLPAGVAGAYRLFANLVAPVK